MSKKTVLEPFDKTLDTAEKMLMELVTKVEQKGIINPPEFEQKVELIKLVCNFHGYKTKNNYYLMARTIKQLSPQQQKLLQQQLEDQDLG